MGKLRQRTENETGSEGRKTVILRRIGGCGLFLVSLGLISSFLLYPDYFDNYKVPSMLGDGGSCEPTLKLAWIPGLERGMSVSIKTQKQAGELAQPLRAQAHNQKDTEAPLKAPASRGHVDTPSVLKETAQVAGLPSRTTSTSGSRDSC